MNCTASTFPASSLSERSGDLSAFGGSRSAGLQGALTLRHANLPTTQLYLRKICDTKAMRWIMK